MNFSKDTYALASLYGIGDLYLTSSLCAAFRARYCTGGKKLTLVCKQSQTDVTRLFGGWDHLVTLTDYAASQIIAERQMVGWQSTLAPGKLHVVHPDFVRVRPDHCVAVGRMTDAAMYAMMMGLDPRVQPAQVGRDEKGDREAERFSAEVGIVPGRTVIIFPNANSWPAVDLALWQKLADELRSEGWMVLFNDREEMPLRCVRRIVEIAGWALGANCGLMQMLVQSRTECRKTILTQSLDGVSYPLPVSLAFPYRRMESVDGNRYDIEEYVVERDNWDRLIRYVARGRCARGPEMPSAPQRFYVVQLSPGEVLDRFSVLELKAGLLVDKWHLLYPEYERLRELRDEIVGDFSAVLPLEQKLHALNRVAWDANQIMFNLFEQNSGLGKGDYSVAFEDMNDTVVRAFRVAGIEANQERVRLKNRINALCGSSEREQKSYDT